MRFKIGDEATLKEFLLGHTPPGVSEQVELWLMSDEKAYDLLNAAEDDLIDEFLARKLSRSELEAFEQRFLASPERQRKLHFSISAKERFATPRVPPAVPSIWDAIANLLRYRPAIAAIASAVVIATVAAFVWTGFRVAEIDQQIADVRRERVELAQQLSETVASRERVQAQLIKLDETVAAFQPLSLPQRLLTLSLLPGILRTSTNAGLLSLSTDANAVQFTLNLLENDYDSYRVTLIDDADGEKILTKECSPVDVDGDKALRLTVPASLLSGNDYHFKVCGRRSPTATVDVDSYHFRAIHQ